MLILSAGEVEAALDRDELVDALAAAMIELSAGRVSLPARVAASVEDRSALLAAMPAYLPSAGVLMAKLVSLFPGNLDRPTHQAVVCCFDPETGSPVAVMDGTHVTAVRTAAGSALATRLLARADAEVVSVIGTGVQARTHARALSRLPGVTTIQIAGRDRSRAESVVEQLTADGVPARTASSIEGAVRSADVVCATTHASDPVIRREWLRPGTHVNSVGYNTASRGEVDIDTVRDALVAVESRAAVLAPPPSGAVEIRLAVERGVLRAPEDLVEIGELASGSGTGRTDDEQLTLYKSVGVAIQDAAAAGLILNATRVS